MFYIVDGFTAGKELFTTTPTSQDGFAVHAWSFYLPAGHASQVGAGGIELRLYAFAAEWGGHDTSLTAFRLVAGLDPVELTLQPGPGGAIVASPAAQWFTPGDVVQVSAAPDPGFRFGGGSGAVAGPGSPRTLVMSADHTGYWGDLEYQHQPPGEAPKHRALTDFATALRAR